MSRWTPIGFAEFAAHAREAQGLDRLAVEAGDRARPRSRRSCRSARSPPISGRRKTAGCRCPTGASPCRARPRRRGKGGTRASRSIHVAPGARSASSSRGCVSAQKIAMYSRTASSTASLSGSAVRARQAQLLHRAALGRRRIPALPRRPGGRRSARSPVCASIAGHSALPPQAPAPTVARTTRRPRMQSTMMDVPLSLNHLLERAGTLFARQRRSSRACPTSPCARTPTASIYRRTRALGVGAAQARAEEGRPRRDALLEPPRAPRVLLRHPGGRRRDAHAEPAPVARRDRLDRGQCEGPLPRRRRRAAAALQAVRAPARVREGDRVSVLGRARCRRSSTTTKRCSTRPTPTASTTRRTTRTTRSPCATRPAPRAGRRASCTRIARRCCTRWSPALGDFWGLQGTDVVLPVTPMFHANSWGMPYGAVMHGREAGVPRPAPASRRPARPDAARAADARRSACRRSG